MVTQLRSKLSDMFQFHKVRLKVQKEYQKVRRTQFQFHKVRLKEKYQFVSHQAENVSIP